MRSGLQKPGAIPFLALLVFLLLSLVSSLAKEWDLYNLHRGYIGSPRHEVRHLPRVKDGPVEVRSRLRTPPAPWKSWIVNDRRRSRPRSVLDTPPRSVMEVAATVDPEQPPSVYVTDSSSSSSSFTRGVRALKTFLNKQFDDDRPIRPTSTLRNASATPMPVGREGLSSSSSSSVGPEEPPEIIRPSQTWVIAMVRDSWQQACRVGGDYLDSIPHISSLKLSLPPSFLQSDSQSPPPPIQKTALNDSAVVKPNLAPPLPLETQALPTPPSNQSMMATAVHPVKEPEQRPEHMRGSCMAIVISLVVGVMWF